MQVKVRDAGPSPLGPKVNGKLPHPCMSLIHGNPFFEYSILWFWRICNLQYIKLKPSLITCRIFFIATYLRLFGSTEGELKKSYQVSNNLIADSRLEWRKIMLKLLCCAKINPRPHNKRANYPPIPRYERQKYPSVTRGPKRSEYEWKSLYCPAVARESWIGISLNDWCITSESGQQKLVNLDYTSACILWNAQF